jgi:hypothetical protein
LVVILDIIEPVKPDNVIFFILDVSAQVQDAALLTFGEFINAVLVAEQGVLEGDLDHTPAAGRAEAGGQG